MDPILSRLNPFDPAAKKMHAFDRFQWDLEGTLARSKQPYYISNDEDHTVKPVDVTFLQMRNIVCIISANSCAMDDEGRRRLTGAGIDFIHLSVEDFGVPKPAELQQVADTVEAYRKRAKRPGATLIYCGASRGRTGTYVAGWAMKEYIKNRPKADQHYTLDFLNKQFGVENEAQAKAISRIVGRTCPGAGTDAKPGIATTNDGLVTIGLPLPA